MANATQTEVDGPHWLAVAIQRADKIRAVVVDSLPKDDQLHRKVVEQLAAALHLYDKLNRPERVEQIVAYAEVATERRHIDNRLSLQLESIASRGLPSSPSGLSTWRVVLEAVLRHEHVILDTDVGQSATAAVLQSWHQIGLINKHGTVKKESVSVFHASVPAPQQLLVCQRIIWPPLVAQLRDVKLDGLQAECKSLVELLSNQGTTSSDAPEKRLRDAEQAFARLLQTARTARETFLRECMRN